MLNYSKLMPLIGQAVARSRRTQRVHYIVERSGLLGKRWAVVDRVKSHDVVLVDAIASYGPAGPTRTARDALAALPIDTQRAVLDFLSALRAPANGKFFEAEELAVTLWGLCTGLSTRSLEDSLR